MALTFGTASTVLHPTTSISSKICKKKIGWNICDTASPSCRKAAAALSEGTDSRFTDQDSPAYAGSSSSARVQLDLLEQLTGAGSSSVDGYTSDGNSGGPTVREQLANLVGDRDDNFSLPLGKNLKKVTAKFLTISQKRNIRRQSYLNEVSRRNDSVFFATIGAFVILPPVVILVIAIAMGYVQLFP
ncbi:insulinase (Peptidase family M16) family protein [Striga asiatica]|uniref:Insulinase (Peptidase family M16) family protein n=1 Tax=Striga asiatica TaxID=4170 RepID=A0A5A7QJ52_STRAF|nr:insulinase (Peptidase family M16) family protein [Striga asiatica]